MNKLPVMATEPLTCWFPSNELLPVIANSVESLPSNKFALSANEAVIALDALTAFDVVPLIVAFMVPNTVKSP